MSPHGETAKPFQAEDLGLTAPKQYPHPSTNSVTPQKPALPGDNSAEAQRQRLIDHIRKYGSITTIEARRDLDILHPGGRVMELRKAGEPIETIRVPDVTPEGMVHNVARYYLAGQDQVVKP